MNAPVEDALYELTAARALRGAALLSLSAGAVFLSPDLEDASIPGLCLIAAAALAFAFLVLSGPAWVFDAEGYDAAMERAGRLCGRAAGCLTALYALLWWQCPYYLAEGAWAVLLAGSGAALCAPAALWRAVDEALSSPRALAAGTDRDPYKLLDAAPAPARPVSLPPSSEAMLVSSGTFRVDRSRMLEVLRDRQLVHATDFLLPWIRTAVASGARTIRLERERGGLSLWFDGRPLAASQLQDPYACLFEEDLDAPRHRQLALGLLALLRLGPRSVRLASGVSYEHARLSMGGDRGDDIPNGENGSGTLIRVRFSSWSSGLLAGECLARARHAFGMTDASLYVSGTLVASCGLDARTPQSAVVDSSLRGTVARVPGASSLRVYHLGALVEDIPFPNSPPGLRAHVVDERLKLSASQSGVVRDRHYSKVVGWIDEQLRGAKLAELPPEPDSLRLAYTRPALAAALIAALAGWAAFSALADRGPEVALFAAAAYVLVTLSALGLCLKWVRNRLAGRRNPFRASQP